MKLRTHTCAVAGCQKQIPTALLMCSEHWRLVPAPLQRDVWKNYRALGRELGAGSRYAEAVAIAVAAVREKQERKAQQDAGPSGNLFT